MNELNKKIRIAIVLDENNANAHDIILEAFLEPEILEIFTPVVFPTHAQAGKQSLADKI